MVKISEKVKSINKNAAGIAASKRSKYGFAMIDKDTKKAILTKTNPGAYVVYEELWAHLNQSTGACFPSQPQLSEDTGMSERTIRTHLKTLKDAGFIDWEVTPGKKNKNDSNRYFFLFSYNKEAEEIIVEDNGSVEEEVKVDIKATIVKDVKPVEAPKTKTTKASSSREEELKSLFKQFDELGGSFPAPEIQKEMFKRIAVDNNEYERLIKVYTDKIKTLKELPPAPVIKW